MRSLQVAVEMETVASRFLHEAALGVADMLPEDLEAGNLTIPFCVSIWIRRSDIDLSGACEALLQLRSALVEASGLDRRSEPVPLLAGDRRSAILGLAVYLDGLVARGARQADTTRRDLARAALDLLEI